VKELKKVIRVKMYACTRVKKMKLHLGLDYPDFVYNARNFLLRFFSM
jgi:hypothetical protein